MTNQQLKDKIQAALGVRQLLDLAREDVVLNSELSRVGEVAQSVQRLLVGIPDTRREHIMPRIIHLAPDGGGRYIAVDRDGDLWRGETMRLAHPMLVYLGRISYGLYVYHFPARTRALDVPVTELLG
jgi:hypothetical protein